MSREPFPPFENPACPGPLACGRCLEVCREGVLMARPEPSGGARQRWGIAVVMRSRCTGCGACLEACPLRAR